MRPSRRPPVLKAQKRPYFSVGSSRIRLFMITAHDRKASSSGIRLAGRSSSAALAQPARAMPREDEATAAVVVVTVFVAQFAVDRETVEAHGHRVQLDGGVMRFESAQQQIAHQPGVGGEAPDLDLEVQAIR